MSPHVNADKPFIGHCTVCHEDTSRQEPPTVLMWVHRSDGRDGIASVHEPCAETYVERQTALGHEAGRFDLSSEAMGG